MATLFPLRAAADALIAAVAGPRRVRVKPAFEASAVTKRMTVIAHVDGAVPNDIPDGVRNDRHRASRFT